MSVWDQHQDALAAESQRLREARYEADLTAPEPEPSPEEREQAKALEQVNWRAKRWQDALHRSTDNVSA